MKYEIIHPKIRKKKELVKDQEDIFKKASTSLSSSSNLMVCLLDLRKEIKTCSPKACGMDIQPNVKIFTTIQFHSQ